MECPACKGNIPEGVQSCPYCGRKLSGGPGARWWGLALLAGALTGAGLFLAYQLLQERRLWEGQSGGEESGSSPLEADLDF